jgi:hypothetical protein
MIEIFKMPSKYFLFRAFLHFRPNRDRGNFDICLETRRRLFHSRFCSSAPKCLKTMCLSSTSRISLVPIIKVPQAVSRWMAAKHQLNSHENHERRNPSVLRYNFTMPHIAQVRLFPMIWRCSTCHSSMSLLLYIISPCILT